MLAIQGKKAINENCTYGDGKEDIEHLFCTCKRTQIAWAWMRRKIITELPELQALSNFEMLNLISLNCTRFLDFNWLTATYIEYVWTQKCQMDNYLIEL